MFVFSKYYETIFAIHTIFTFFCFNLLPRLCCEFDVYIYGRIIFVSCENKKNSYFCLNI